MDWLSEGRPPFQCHPLQGPRPVLGLGAKGWGSGIRKQVECLGSKVQVLGMSVQGQGFGMWVSGFRYYGRDWCLV